MLDPLIDLAQSEKSCVFCATPQGIWSPLRQGVIWPGSPRNFAVEPVWWRDFMVYLQTMTSTDFTFEIEYDLKSVPDTIKYIWCPANGNYSSATIWVEKNTVTIRDFAYYPEIISRYITSNILGKHTVKINQTGRVINLFYDGVLLQSVTLSATPKPPSYAPAYPADSHYNPQTNADCTIAYVKFSCGDVAWSYPSLSERLRLITSTNVLNAGTHWGAANPALAARIKTALDLRGATASKTFVCRCHIPSHPGSSAGHFAGLITQGNWMGGTPDFVFHLSVREDYRPGLQAKRLRMNCSNGANVLRGVEVDISAINIFDKDITIAGVLDPAAGQARIFADGVQIANSSVELDFLGQGALSALSDRVSLMHDPLTTSTLAGHRIIEAAVFNKALAADKIAYASR